MIDELVIGLRVTAEGVKQGVATATGALRQLQEYQKKLNEELKMKIDDKELSELYSKMRDIIAQKNDLKQELRMKLNSDEIVTLRRDIREAQTDKAKLAEKIRVELDPEKKETLKAEMKELSASLALLESEKKLKITVVEDETRVKLDGLDAKLMNIKKDINIKITALEIPETEDALYNLNQTMKETAELERQTERASAGAAVAYAALGAAGAKAFREILSAVKEGISAYTEVVGAQTRLANVMDLTMNAASGQVREILELTKAQEELGIVSATAQQVGAQELATYMKRTESLKELIPVMNDIVAQQYGYAASAENVRNVATMLGKVFEGEVGSLKRFGYVFTEAQENILKFGTEAERVATLIKVIGNVVGGTNEALAQTDAGKLTLLANEAERTKEAFGEAMTSSISGFAMVLKEVASGVADFVQNNKAFTAGLTSSGIAILGTITLLGALATAMKLTKLVAAELKLELGTIFPVLVIVGAAVGIFMGIAAAINNAENEQKELNKKQEEYNKLLAATTTEENIEAKTMLRQEIANLISDYDKLIAKRREYEESGTYVDEAGRMTKEYAQTLKDLADTEALLAEKSHEAGRTIDELRGDIVRLTEQTERYNKELAEQLRIEEQRKKASEVADQIRDVESLYSAYDKLAKGESLATDEMLRLIDKYPQIAKYIAETNDLTLKQGELLKDVIVDVKQYGADVLNEAKKTYERRIKIIQADIEAERQKYLAMGRIARLFYEGNKDDMTAKRLEEIDNMLAEIAKADAQIKAIEAYTVPPGGGGSSAEDAAKKRYDADRKIYEDQKALTELSLKEEIAALEELKARHRDYADGVMAIDREIYGLRRELANEWYEKELRNIEEQNRRAGGAFDYSGYINGLNDFKAELMRVYADYPETLRKLLDEVDKLETEAAEARSDKVLKIESDKIDKLIDGYDFLIRKYQAMKGLKLGDGTVFEFGAADQADIVRRQLAEAESEIKRLEALGAKMTESERQELDKRLAQRESYQREIEILVINGWKEEQSAYEKHLKEMEDAAKASNKVLVQSIKDRYSEEIKAAQAASDTKIKLYQDEIDAIDELLKQQDRASEDEDQLGNIRRLQEQLSYERDDTNRYELQKQITQEQADYEKRKGRESLEDQKDALRGRIDAAKDALAEQKQLLEEQRDAEVKAAEQSLEDYLAGLQSKRDTELKYNADVTKNLVSSLDERQNAMDSYYKKAEEDAKINADKSSQIAESGVAAIVTMLYRKLEDFAAVGREAGQAYANAFNSAISGMSVFSGVGNTGSITGGGSSFKQVTVNNTFNTAGQSPAQIALEVNRSAERMIYSIND